jgi:hypothetical protein
MADTEAKTHHPGNQLAGAIAGWESEGGAASPGSRRNRDERASLTEDEEHILR